MPVLSGRLFVADKCLVDVGVCFIMCSASSSVYRNPFINLTPPFFPFLFFSCSLPLDMSHKERPAFLV